jgi:hypothetical protein
MPQSAFGVQHAMPAAGFGHSEGLQTPGVGVGVFVAPSDSSEPTFVVVSSHATAGSSPRALRIRNRFTAGLL